MKSRKILSYAALSLSLLFFVVSVDAAEGPRSKEASKSGSPKTLILKGVLLQQDGKPAENIKVYMQKAFFPDNDKSRLRTEFTTNDQGSLSMPFGTTDNRGNFTVTFPLERSHLNFVLSLRQGRVSLDFSSIKLIELTRDAWEKDNKYVLNVGKISLPEGLEIAQLEKGNY